MTEQIIFGRTYWNKEDAEGTAELLNEREVDFTWTVRDNGDGTYNIVGTPKN